MRFESVVCQSDTVGTPRKQVLSPSLTDLQFLGSLGWHSCWERCCNRVWLSWKACSEGHSNYLSSALLSVFMLLIPSFLLTKRTPRDPGSLFKMHLRLEKRSLSTPPVVSLSTQPIFSLSIGQTLHFLALTSQHHQNMAVLCTPSIISQ